MNPNNIDTRKLTETLLRVGMEAQHEAMLALTSVVEKHVGDSTDNTQKVIALAGAIGFTQFKLEQAMEAIRKTFPPYGRLIDGVRATAHEVLGPDYADHALDLARKFNIDTDQTV